MKAAHVARTAPVGGWNARDSLDAMEPTDAVVMDNWFPNAGWVETRKGYVRFCEDLGGYVQTLTEFHGGSARQLIAGADGELWNVSSGAGVSLGSGFTNDKWQSVNFLSQLSLVNGDDTPKKYDGTTLSDNVITGTDLTATNIIGVHVYRNRVWYWMRDSQDAYYTAVDTIGGATTKFPLGNLSYLGGNIVCVGTWSRDDAGETGAEDVIVFFMSSGQAIAYRGDPAVDFSLVGVFNIGEPLSVRAAFKYGADLICMTRDGYVSMTQVMSLGTANFSAYISDKIRGAVTAATQKFGPRFGWEVVNYSRGNRAIFNVPTGQNTYQQHVVNTITGAWCRFKGINSQCWAIYNDELYFGGNGIVYKADSGFADDGAVIDNDCQAAWDYLGSRSNKKQITMAVPVMSYKGALGQSFTIGADFGRVTQPSASQCTLLTSVGTPWSSPWGSPWGGDALNANSQPRGAAAWGFNFSLRNRLLVNAQTVRWLSTNYVVKLGGLV